jgi:hypothetical protein
MIQIPCLYCGKKLTAKEEWVGKKVKCPACTHMFFIGKGHRPVNENAANDSAKHDDRYWAAKSNQEIAQMLLNRYDIKIPDKTAEDEEHAEALHKRQAQYWESKSDEEIAHMLLEPSEEPEVARPFFVPSYDDITLFTLATTFLLLLFINGQFQSDIRRLAAFGIEQPRFYLVAGPFLLGLLLSLINIFFAREKSELEKALMLVFAVAITVATGLYAGWVMWQSYTGWLLVFPVWNIANATVLLLYCRAGAITTKCIVGVTASFFDIASNTIAIIVLLAVCQYVFRLHWVYTYSIVVCYATSVHSVLDDFFGRAMALKAKKRRA